MRKRNCRVGLAALTGVMLMTLSGCGSQPQKIVPEIKILDKVNMPSQSGSKDVNPEAPVRIWGNITSAEEDSITVDNQSDASSAGEMILHIDPKQSMVVDAVDGTPVNPADVESGSFVAYLGQAMTLSLPPQATVYAVIVNIPEDFKAPAFLIAAGNIVETDNGNLLDACDGQDYLLADDADIRTYPQGNAAKMENIQSGSRCMVWTDEYDRITRLLLQED